MTVIAARWQVMDDLSESQWLRDAGHEVPEDWQRYDGTRPDLDELLERDEAAARTYMTSVLERITGESVWFVPASEVESQIRAGHGRGLTEAEEAEAEAALDDWQASVDWASA